MDNLTLKSPAKINLFLRIIGKKDDGYHEISTFFQMVSLFDLITLTRKNQGIEIVSTDNKVPQDCTNLAYKAADALRKFTNVDTGVLIKIEKNIPVAAGLGGGSSNAATTLIGLNKLWNLHLSYDDLFLIARTLGADVPFFLSGPTAYAEGIGDIITCMPSLKGVPIVLINPHISISAKWAYENLQLTSFANVSKIIDYFSSPGSIIDANSLLEGITFLKDDFKNDLEKPVIKRYDEIGVLKNLLKEYGAQFSLMSGSGSTVFGIFDDLKTAKSAYDRLVFPKWSVFLTQTVSDRNYLFSS